MENRRRGEGNEDDDEVRETKEDGFPILFKADPHQ